MKDNKKLYVPDSIQKLYSFVSKNNMDETCISRRFFFDLFHREFYSNYYILDDIRNEFTEMSPLVGSIACKVRENGENRIDRLETIRHLLRYKFLSLLSYNKRVLDCACFVGGTKVLVNNYEEKNIENINVGDLVLTQLGNYKKVINTHKLSTDKTIKIKSPYGYNIECTSNHLILAVDKNNVRCKHDKQQFCNTSDNGNCNTCGKIKPFKSKYIRSDNLSIGDFLCIPKRDSCGILEDNRNLAILLGYYLSEGNRVYSHKPHICGLKFTLNANEHYIANEIEKSAKMLECTSVSRYNYPYKPNTMSVIVFGKRLANLIIELGGIGCSEKHIHPSVFKWRDEDKIDLIRCWFNGDGHHKITTNSGEQLVGKTVSLDLAMGIRELLKSLNILCGFHKETPKNRKIVYTLTLCSTDIEYFCDRQSKYSSKKRYRQDDDYFYIPIISMENIEEQKFVYDITVEDTHSYTANGMAVHNCGCGYGSYILSKTAKEVVGIDLDSPSINFANRYNKSSNISFYLSSIEHFNNRKFDLVVSVETFEHIPPEKIDSFLSGLKSSVKLNGLIAITTPRIKSTRVYSEKNIGFREFHSHCKEYSKSDFIDVLARNGLKVKQYLLQGFDGNFVYQIPKNAKFYDNMSKAWVQIAICSKEEA